MVGSGSFLADRGAGAVRAFLVGGAGAWAGAGAGALRLAATAGGFLAFRPAFLGLGARGARGLGGAASLTGEGEFWAAALGRDFLLSS